MSELQQNSLAHQAATGPVISLLAEFWLHPVDDRLVPLWNDHLTRLYSEAFGKPAEHIASRDCDEHAVNYTRLFVGPRNHLPPIQSVWTEGQLVSTATRSMQTYCDRLGWCSPDDGTPVDHFGQQLSVLGHLLSAQSSESVAIDVVAEYAAAHLAWTDDFLARVVATRNAGVYGQLAELTQACLTELRDCFQELNASQT